MSRFEGSCEALVAAIRDGASIADASASVGVSCATVRRWLTTGRREPEGVYGRFAERVDAIRGERQDLHRELEQALTVKEAEAILAKLARRGSVPALKLWFDRHGGDKPDGDELSWMDQRTEG